MSEENGVKKKHFLLKSLWVVFCIIFSVAVVAIGAGVGYVYYKGGLDNVRTYVAGNCEEKGYTEYLLPLGYTWKVYDNNVGECAYDEGTVVVDATCTTDGQMKYVCTCCGKEKTEVIKAHHTYSGYVFDDVQHWQVCDVCHETTEKVNHSYQEQVIDEVTCTDDGLKRHICECGNYHDEVVAHTGTEHHFTVEVSRVESTCHSAGHITKKCQDCVETQETVLPIVSHKYEGCSCKWCDRDELLDFKDEFESYGSQSNPIEINSEDELICLVSYVINDLKTSADDDVWFKVNIDGVVVDYESIDMYISYIISKMVCATWPSIGHTKMIYGSECLAKIYCNGNVGDMASTSILTHYSLLPQMKSLQFADAVNTRNSDPDECVFPYESRTTIMDCFTSNQLFYAFSKGYKPVVVPDSPAEECLDAARAINCQFISDSMSDVEKLWAIYSWLIENVQYDNDALSKSANWLAYKAWYAEGALIDKTAVCDGISKAFCILAGIENIKCVQVSGCEHAWNKVCVDANGDGEREWYVIDATHGNVLMNPNEVMILSRFMITDEQRIFGVDQDDIVIATNYLDCVANTKFNAYQFLHFGTEPASSENDYYIESSTDIANLASFIDSAADSLSYGEKISIDVLISADFGLKAFVDSIRSSGALNTVIVNKFGGTYSQSSELIGNEVRYLLILTRE